MLKFKRKNKKFKILLNRINNTNINYNNGNRVLIITNNKFNNKIKYMKQQTNN